MPACGWHQNMLQKALARAHSRMHASAAAAKQSSQQPAPRMPVHMHMHACAFKPMHVHAHARPCLHPGAVKAAKGHRRLLALAFEQAGLLCCVLVVGFLPGGGLGLCVFVPVERAAPARAVQVSSVGTTSMDGHGQVCCALRKGVGLPS